MTNCFVPSDEVVGLIILLTLSTILLFFWSIYKAIKTQKPKYAWGMVPFFLIMAVMFIR